jgi:hypothetical protein
MPDVTKDPAVVAVMKRLNTHPETYFRGLLRNAVKDTANLDSFLISEDYAERDVDRLIAKAVVRALKAKGYTSADQITDMDNFSSYIHAELDRCAIIAHKIHEAAGHIAAHLYHTDNVVMLARFRAALNEAGLCKLGPMDTQGWEETGKKVIANALSDMEERAIEHLGRTTYTLHGFRPLEKGRERYDGELNDMQQYTAAFRGFMAGAFREAKYIGQALGGLQVS